MAQLLWGGPEHINSVQYLTIVAPPFRDRVDSHRRWDQLYLQFTTQWVHCIFCINVTCIAAALLTTVTSYFADWWQNFVLNIPLWHLVLYFYFVYLKWEAFQRKNSFTSCLYSVLRNGPPVLAVCKTLQKLKKQLYNRKYQNSIYLPLTQGMNGRLTKCFSNSPHKWAMRRRRHKIEKPSQFERKRLFLEFQRK